MVDSSKIRASFKKRSNGRLQGRKHFTSGASDENAPREAFRWQRPQLKEAASGTNRENAYSKVSLVRIIGMGQGGFQKKKTFAYVTRRGRRECEAIPQ
jgi:hypothetical protein